MTTFLDTSALVKRYVDEDGMAAARAIASPMVVSDLARVEAAAALWRHHRLGAIGLADASRLAAAVAHDLSAGSPSQIAVIALTPGLVADAAALTARHPLRAGDAIQLASALAARDADPAVESFAAADRALADAAEREGFLMVPGL